MSKSEWKRVQSKIENERRIAQAQCRSMGHDWSVGLNPVTLTPKERICRRCLRRERPLTLWLKR
jgi:hypothetical protein